MKRIVSLEITSTAIRAAEILNPFSKKPVLVNYSYVETPDGSTGESEIYETEQVADLLKELWSTAGFKTNKVAIGVSSPRTIVKSFIAPYIPLGKLRKTLHYEAHEEVSDPDNSLLDFYPIDKIENREEMTGLLLVARKEPIQKIMTALTLANLKPEIVDFSPFGQVRALRMSSHGAESRDFLINIGEETSSITAIKNGSPRMIRIVSVGVPANSAALKYAAGSDSSFRSSGNLNTTSPIDSFIAELRKTVDFYTGKGGVIDNLYITGEGAVSAEVKEKTQKLTSAPVKHLTINDIIPIKDKARDDSLSDKEDLMIRSALFSAVGTGLRGGLK